LVTLLADNKIAFVVEKETNKLSIMDAVEIASKYTVQVSCKGIPFAGVTAPKAAS